MALIKLTYDFVESTHTLRIFPVEDEHPFFRFMEDFFTVQVFFIGDYYNMYRKSNFYNSRPGWVGWGGCDYISFSSREQAIKETVNILEKYISQIKVGEDFLELATKMRLFSNYHVFSIENGYTVYTDCIMSFERDKNFDFSFEIVDVSDNNYRSDRNFDINVNCAVSYTIEDKIVKKNFVVKATTFESIYYNSKKHIQQIIPRHIVANSLKIDWIKDLVYKTISHIKASSEEELMLKLSIFADKFYPLEYFLPLQLSKGETNSFCLCHEG